MPSARLVPELMVSNHAASRDFYVRLLGFEVRYAQPMEKVSYLDLAGAS
jgi:catechol 2,3-dioxygenase-like lactoylglutathione lyase family enzyme